MNIFPSVFDGKSIHYATEVFPSKSKKNISLSSQFTFLKQNLNTTTSGNLQKGLFGVDEVIMDIDDLYPALVECFAVIILGYIAGRTGIITQFETKGLNTFIGTFCLPALIFSSMAALDLRSVNWYFLLAIGLAKSVVFFSVIIISVLVNRPIRLDKAGLFAIFCTQSNDFALGYPIVEALYKKTNPEYSSYLYLVAPINLIMLNLVAFVLMEVEKQKNLEIQNVQDSNGAKLRDGWITVVKRVSSGVLLNPVVLMTVLGICANLIFNHCVPTVLAGTLKVLGSAFSACALFSLGLTIVGSAASLKGSGFVVPGILISMKLLVLPIVTREFVSLLNPGANANETMSLSNYGFLYGTFPAAPGVFVYAIQYNVAVEMIAGAMVACTFISAPLMFVSAKMVTIGQLNPKDYIHELDTYLFDISIIGFVASIVVIIVFLLSNKWRKVPHCFTGCLVISQAFACLGAILWSYIGVDGINDWRLYLQFSVFSFGVLSSRIWTALLAISLVFLRCRSLCFVLRMRPYLVLIGWGIPAALIGMLFLIVKRELLNEKHDPNFQYGETQALVSAMVLLVSLLVTLGCLVMQRRYEREYSVYESLRPQRDSINDNGIYSENSDDDSPILSRERERDNTNPGSSSTSTNTTTALTVPSAHRSQRKKCSNGSCQNCPKVGSCSKTAGTCCNSCDKPTCGERHKNPAICITQIEDLAEENNFEDEGSLFNHSDDLCSATKHPCDAIQRRRCTLLLERYRAMSQLTRPEEIGIVRDRDDEFQMLRHIVLLLCLCASMFVGIALCLWTLIMDDVSGIYVELVFLDATLNFGQGFFAFMLFGLNTKLIVMPIQNWWRKLVYGEGSVTLSKWEDLPQETKQICAQFLKYHLDKCIQDIVRDRRWRMETFEQVFAGQELVDWLLLVGLARDRGEAVKYGKHLLNGRVIRHVKNLHHFHDQPFFYVFSN